MTVTKIIQCHQNCRIASKTSHLKSIALEMEGEARDHHRLLDDLDSDFDSTKGFLGNTMNRVVLMTQSGRANRLTTIL